MALACVELETLVSESDALNTFVTPPLSKMSSYC